MSLTDITNLADITIEILTERNRQVAKLGSTDDISNSAFLTITPHGIVPPYDPATRRADLIRAAALLVAEIERIDRAANLQPK